MSDRIPEEIFEPDGHEPSARGESGERLPDERTAPQSYTHVDADLYGEDATDTEPNTRPEFEHNAAQGVPPDREAGERLGNTEENNGIPDSASRLNDGEENQNEEKQMASAPELYNKKNLRTVGAHAPAGQNRGMLFFLAALIPVTAAVIFGCIVMLLGRGNAEKDSMYTLFGVQPAEALDLSPGDADEEMRGVYIASAYNINYPSKKGLSARQLASEADRIVDFCAQNRLNTIFFQVSPYSDALWHSEILPSSSVVTGREGAAFPGDFDILEYVCKAAHEKGIAVHAWVNPMRITTGALDKKALSRKNPAVKNPELTVEYGGELYYNLGLPEVRELAASVCAELAENYDIQGIIFDDYFYPYPIEGQDFDDSAAYEKYGGDYSDLGDFRRASCTELARSCMKAIKDKKSDCLFGIAPFGIWQNDDGRNNGSATRGFEAYKSLYCDVLDMARTGALDYLAPQIYWQLSSEAAPYEELCSWWNAALEGTGVKYYISHAAYKSGEWDAGEIARQIASAREYKNYRGSILYGYAALYGNDSGVTDSLGELFSTRIKYIRSYSDGTQPSAAVTAEADGCITLSGTSDPGYGLTANGKVCSQKKDGSFTVTLNKPQDGVISLLQNGNTTEIHIN